MGGVILLPHKLRGLADAGFLLAELVPTCCGLRPTSLQPADDVWVPTTSEVGVTLSAIVSGRRFNFNNFFTKKLWFKTQRYRYTHILMRKSPTLRMMEN